MHTYDLHTNYELGFFCLNSLFPLNPLYLQKVEQMLQKVYLQKIIKSSLVNEVQSLEKCIRILNMLGVFLFFKLKTK